jgi:hypothetical protein
VNRADQLQQRLDQRSELPYQSPAGPKSGLGQYNNFDTNPYDLNTLTSTTALGPNNTSVLGEFTQAEKIRRKNQQRLEELQKATKHFNQKDERNNEFSNIRDSLHLASYDAKVFKLLTPEASRGKSLGLLNSG